MGDCRAFCAVCGCFFFAGVVKMLANCNFADGGSGVGAVTLQSESRCLLIESIAISSEHTGQLTRDMAIVAELRLLLTVTH